MLPRNTFGWWRKTLLLAIYCSWCMYNIGGVRYRHLYSPPSSELTKGYINTVTTREGEQAGVSSSLLLPGQQHHKQWRPFARLMQQHKLRMNFDLAYATTQSMNTFHQANATAQAMTTFHQANASAKAMTTFHHAGYCKITSNDDLSPCRLLQNHKQRRPFTRLMQQYKQWQLFTQLSHHVTTFLAKDWKEKALRSIVFDTSQSCSRQCRRTKCVGAFALSAHGATF